MIQADGAGPGLRVLFRLGPLSIRFAHALRRCGIPVGFVTVDDRAVPLARDLVADGAVQLTEQDWLTDGTYYAGRQNLIATARELSRRYPGLQNVLAAWGGSPGHGRMAVGLLAAAVEHEAFMAPVLAKEAARRNKLTVTAVAMAGAFGQAAAGIAFTRWHRPLAELALLAERTASAAVVLAFPLLNLLHLMRKGVRPGRAPAPAGDRPARLFVHRETDLRGPRDRYRDMYFIDHGLLDPAQWQHTPMATSARFSARKRARLEAAGGVIVESAGLRPPLADLLKHAVARPVRHVLPLAWALLRCRPWRWRATAKLLETLHFMVLCPLLLERTGARTVLLETEVSQFGQVLAAETRRRGGKAVSMIHGSGAQHTVVPSRLELQIAEMLVYGGWDDALRASCPAIERCVPVGNIELDELDRTGACLPAELKPRPAGIRIIGFFARLSHVLTTERSSVTGTRYVDAAAQAERARAMLEPLFVWMAADPSIVLLWQAGLDGFADGTETDGNGEPRIRWLPWLAPVMRRLPPERFLYRPQALLGEVVANCDLALCNDVSSAFACAMSAGIPALSLDYVFGGMFRRYHPRLAAVTADEAVDNAQWLLANPLPDEVFHSFNRDFYGKGDVDFRSAERVKAYLEALVAEGDHS